METGDSRMVKPPLDPQGYQELHDYLDRAIAEAGPVEEITNEEMFVRMTDLRRELEGKANPKKTKTDRGNKRTLWLKRW